MTETERLLLDSLKKLESQYTEREIILEARLKDLSFRLDNMTANYKLLSKQMNALSELLDGTSSDSAHAKT